MKRRCRAPACGLFVKADAEYCDRHIDPAPVEVLAEELDALRYVLRRLRKEVKDVEIQAKYVPRVSSVAIQATRAQYQIGGGTGADILAALTPTLEELDRETERTRG